MSPDSAAIRWLTGDRADRSRYQDMHRRFRDAPLFGAAVGGSTLVAAVWYGWPLVVLVVLALMTMGVGLAVGSRSAVPELFSGVTFLLLQLNLAASVVVSGGGHSPLLPLMAVPVFTQAVCFRPQVTGVAVTLSGLLAVGATALAPLAGSVHHAPAVVHLVSYLGLLACLALAARYLADADLTSRDVAVVDPLTGLFNRTALETRFADARAQARALDGTVAVIMCDADRFKDVNDTYGHERGDQVLRELADRMRGTLRSFDLVYRVGGEEFLILLPNHDEDAAAEVAHRLLTDIAGAPIAGLSVTLSAGLAAARGESINLETLTKAADVALYDAKRAGRNRVIVAGRRGTSLVG